MRLSFRYKRVKVRDIEILRPMIPLTLRHFEKRISIIGILDSGSDFILIPKDVAEYLRLEFGKKTEEADAIGGVVKTVSSVLSLTITDNRNTVHLHNVPIEILSEGSLKEIIIGRIPFFNEFDVIFRQNSNRIELVRVKRR